MKVIKEGKKSTMRVVCENCDAELEINAKDLKKEPDDDEGYGSYYYTCPCCHSIQYLRPNYITQEIRLEFSKLNK